MMIASRLLRGFSPRFRSALHPFSSFSVSSSSKTSLLQASSCYFSSRCFSSPAAAGAESLSTSGPLSSSTPKSTSSSIPSDFNTSASESSSSASTSSGLDAKHAFLSAALLHVPALGWTEAALLAGTLIRHAYLFLLLLNR